MKNLVFGILLTVIGVVLYYLGFKDRMGSMERTLKVIVPATVIVVLGIQTILFSFFFSFGLVV